MESAAASPTHRRRLAGGLPAAPLLAPVRRPETPAMANLGSRQDPNTTLRIDIRPRPTSDRELYEEACAADVAVYLRLDSEVAKHVSYTNVVIFRGYGSDYDYCLPDSSSPSLPSPPSSSHSVNFPSIMPLWNMLMSGTGISLAASSSSCSTDNSCSTSLT